jgi:hypothetical protein
VRAVDDDAHAVEAVRQRREQVVGVALPRRLGDVDDAADRSARRALPFLTHPPLDRVLDVVGQLVTAAGEELDAVVGHGVVAGREHHPEVGAELAGQVGDRRRRQHPDALDVDTGAGEAGDHGGLEELPRRPRVAPDDRDRPVPRERAGVGEHVGRRDGKVERELRGEVAVRQPADTVGAEESSHA